MSREPSVSLGACNWPPEGLFPGLKSQTMCWTDHQSGGGRRPQSWPASGFKWRWWPSPQRARSPSRSCLRGRGLHSGIWPRSFGVLGSPEDREDRTGWGRAGAQEGPMMERGKRRTDLPGPSLRLRVHTSPLWGHPGYRIGAPPTSAF